MQPEVSPPARGYHGMAYDPQNDHVLLWGGYTPGELDLRVWAYDYHANSWQALAPSQSPGKRAHFPMAYAPSVDKAILFGGELTSKTADEISDEIWVFDPATDDWQTVSRP